MGEGSRVPSMKPDVTDRSYPTHIWVWVGGCFQGVAHSCPTFSMLFRGYVDQSLPGTMIYFRWSWIPGHINRLDGGVITLVLKTS